jgi:hypothetical protein
MSIFLHVGDQSFLLLDRVMDRQLTCVVKFSTHFHTRQLKRSSFLRFFYFPKISKKTNKCLLFSNIPAASTILRSEHVILLRAMDRGPEAHTSEGAGTFPFY